MASLGKIESGNQTKSITTSFIDEIFQDTWLLALAIRNVPAVVVDQTLYKTCENMIEQVQKALFAAGASEGLASEIKFAHCVFLDEAVMTQPDIDVSLWWKNTPLHLSKPLNRDISVPEDTLRIHCVPLINLFSLNAEPLKVEPAKLDYRLRPHRLRDHHTEIYSVDKMAASETLDKRQYVPFRQFWHKGGMLQRKDSWPERYFHTRIWRGVTGMHETLLMLGGTASEQDLQEENATLFLNITCTNGNYPRLALDNAVFDGMTTAGNQSLCCQTRQAPSMPCYPPLSELYQWHAMALLHPRALSRMIDSAKNLRAVLQLFNWTEDKDNLRRINGVSHVSYKQAYSSAEEWHGVHISIELDETQFSGIGDARLFCELLEQFFTQYASIARFTQLTVTLAESGTKWEWPMRTIHRVLM